MMMMKMMKMMMKITNSCLYTHIMRYGIGTASESNSEKPVSTVCAALISANGGKSMKGS